MDIVERLRIGCVYDCEGSERPNLKLTEALMDEASAEIERLRAELAARDGEIADWLRTLYHVRDRDGVADALERGAYKDTQKTV